MDGQTLKRLGSRLQKEIVPLHDLPFPIRQALQKLAEKYDRPDLAVPEEGHGSTEQSCEHGKAHQSAQAPAPER